jgi:hypothetical protein
LLKGELDKVFEMQLRVAKPDLGGTVNTARVCRTKKLTKF